MLFYLWIVFERKEERHRVKSSVTEQILKGKDIYIYILGKSDRGKEMDSIKDFRGDVIYLEELNS